MRKFLMVLFISMLSTASITTTSAQLTGCTPRPAKSTEFLMCSGIMGDYVIRCRCGLEVAILRARAFVTQLNNNKLLVASRTFGLRDAPSRFER